MDSYPRRRAPGRRLRLILAAAAVVAVASIALPATASAASGDRSTRSHSICLLDNPLPIPPACLFSVPGPHLPQATLSGSAQEGQPLTCANNVLSIPVIGNLLNLLPKTWKFQRNGSQVASGASPVYVLSGADVGSTVTCTLQIGGSIQIPNPLFPVGPQNFSLPIGTITSTPSVGKGPVTSLPLDNTAAPTISGTAQDGQTLTCTPGSWSVTPASSTLEWLRNGSVVGGGASYGLTASDVGQSVTCRESVTRFERSNSAESAAVTPTAKPVVNNPAGGGGGGTVNPPVNNPVTNTQGTTPTNNALARRRAIARRRAAAIKKCRTKFRKASQRKKRAACIKKAKRRYRVR